MDVRDFLDLFLSESREHLDALNALLGRARRETLGAEEINDLFRRAHSLKGMAAAMGMGPIAELAHAMEDLFHAWRDAGRVPSAEAFDLLQRGADRLAAQIDGVASGGSPGAAPDLVAALRAFVPPAGAPAPGPPVAAGRAPGAPAPKSGAPETAPRKGGAGSGPGSTRLHLEVTLRPDAPLPAARALVIVKRLEEVGRVLEASPTPAAIASGDFRGPLRLTLATDLTPQRLQAIVLALPDVAACVARPARPARRGADRRAGDERRAADGRRAAEGRRAAPEEPPADGGAGPAPSRGEGIGTVRIATERMDRLLDGVGELILDRERLKRVLGSREGSPEGRVIEDLERTIDALRDEVVAMRLLPFALLQPRLERMVRDLAHRLGKEVELAVRGSDVALDRSILEEMMDPLQHILRNSIDHGIEEAAARRTAGKPPAGRIEITLAPADDRVTLTVEDDGRGIDPAALRRVAVERRFLPREAAERLSDDEALMLITLPGFSTAARTTEISGRGVGMDVVLTRVRKLGGRLAVRSRIGAGTRFEMDLPPTVTVTRAFLCRAAGDIYAVPVSVVQSTLHVRSERLQASHGEQLLRRDDEVVTVLALQGLLRGPEAPAQPAAPALPASFPALLYREGERAYALAVEEILGEEEIVVKPLKHPLELLPQYAGAAILNDGRIALILDPANLARGARAA
jgi:two-component system chemotaxis sensor kinase CheA